MIERATGLSLEEYFQMHILAPLGVEDVTCFPSARMKSQLANMHVKVATNILPYDHVCRRPLVIKPEEQDTLLCSGGSGLFGRPTEYLSVSLHFSFALLLAIFLYTKHISNNILTIAQ